MTPKQTKFARLLFECGNQTEAYRRSYNVESMSDSSVYSAAYELSNHPEVVAYIEEMTLEAQIVAQLSEAWVIRRYMDLATADVNELIEARRVCCRYCHGVDHAYQWIDLKEWADEYARVMNSNSRAKIQQPLPDDSGGVGFSGMREPHPSCPRCYGEGGSYIHVHDTRKLKGAARMLYAGVKQTKDGIQVLTRDQDAALAFLARHLGLDKKTLEVIPPGGSLPKLTTDPAEASRIYAAVMAGKPE